MSGDDDGAGEVDAGEIQEPASRVLVQRLLDEWGKLLLGGDRNNNLYRLRPLRKGTLDLSGARRPALNQLLAGKEVSASRLFEAAALPDAVARLRAMHNVARLYEEERGIETLRLTVGCVTWTTTGAPPQAPVLLRRLAAVPVGAARSEFKLSLDERWEFNSVLQHALRTDHGVELDDELIDLPTESDELAAAVIELVERLASGKVPGLVVSRRLLAANTAFQKAPMVRDLENALEIAADHELVCAIAGSRRAQQALREQAAAAMPTEDEPNLIPPANEFLVLDADASQNFAINAVCRGSNLIVKGPPGTGKSQTISNLIATLAAQGKTVLFVAEKRAAIEAVVKRLDAQGLGDLVFDLHGKDNKREIAQELAAAYQAIRNAQPSRDVDARELDTARRRLLAYVDALHERRSPWDVRVADLYATLAGFSDEERTDLRLPAPTLELLVDDVPNDSAHCMARLAELGRFDGRLDRDAPWGRTPIVDEEDAESAAALAQEVADVLLPAAEHATEALLRDLGQPVDAGAITPDAALALTALASDVAEVEARLGSPGWDEPLSDLAEALAPGAAGGIGRLAASLFSGRYRSALARVRALGSVVDPEPLESSDAATITRLAASVIRRQSEMGGGRPRQVPELELHRKAIEALIAALPDLEAAAGRPLAGESLAGLHRDTRALVRAERDLLATPEARTLEGQLVSAGFGQLIAEARADGLTATAAGRRCQFLIASSLLDHIRRSDRALRTFRGTDHDDTVRRFRELDQRQVREAASVRVRRLWAQRAVDRRNNEPEQEQLLTQEAARKRGHLPLRRLVDGAGDVLLALKPCWAMSPLLVSTVLPLRPGLFDVVVFDEASQVQPPDAAPTILRAGQLVVAGDERQLPPTAFFMAQSEEDEARYEDDHDIEPDDVSAVAGTSGAESILTALTPYLPMRMLDWHYRSQDERLIAFSNAHVYHGALTTFPGAGDEPPVRLVRTPTHADAEATSLEEAEQVAELIATHATEHPDESLGVICLGTRHLTRVEEAWRRRAEGLPDGADEFFDETRADPFFVKTIERVQGDERDVIILSIGVARDATGQVNLAAFGPMNRADSERRVNVAVTRARKRVVVVSSLSSRDLEHRTTRHGTDLIRRYLSYAESECADLTRDADATNIPLNAFELDIKAALEGEGLRLRPQYGVGRYRIDFAVEHPDEPGRFVLAVECDGASYHAMPTARDRDRLRQQQLEMLGWRFHRIWSTDWFLDRESALNAVLSAYERVLATGISTASIVPGADADHRSDARPSRGALPEGIYATARTNDFTDDDLEDVALWVQSDGVLRTDDEIVDEMARALGFERITGAFRRRATPAVRDLRARRLI